MEQNNPACHPLRAYYAMDLCERCYHRFYRRQRKALGRPMPSLMSKAQREAYYGSR